MEPEATTITLRTRCWQPLTKWRLDAQTDIGTRLLEEAVCSLDDGAPDVVAFAAWGIDNGVVRFFTHFWPREVEALGRLDVHELAGPVLNGDMWLGKLRLIHDVTQPGQGLVTAVQDAFHWLYGEQVAHDDHVVSVHDDATGYLGGAFMYDEEVRFDEWERRRSGDLYEGVGECEVCEGLVESTGSP